VPSDGQLKYTNFLIHDSFHHHSYQLVDLHAKNNQIRLGYLSWSRFRRNLQYLQRNFTSQERRGINSVSVI